MFHSSPGVDLNFYFNYNDDRKEDTSSIKSVIGWFLLCPFVLSLFCTLFLEVELTKHVPLNKKRSAYLLVHHNSAAGRHFLLA